MGNDREWPCKHIYKHSEKYWAFTVGHSGIGDHVNYCYSCGAKRPKEPKALWELLEERFGYWRGGVRAKDCADFVIGWFRKEFPAQEMGESHNDYAIRIIKWFDNEQEKCS